MCVHWSGELVYRYIMSRSRQREWRETKRKRKKLSILISTWSTFLSPVRLHRLHRQREVSRRAPGLQEDAHRVHERATGGAGEGVPLQPLPVQAAAGGDGQPAQPPGEADQDLVPEPEDEAEEGRESAGPRHHHHQQQHHLHHHLLFFTPVLPLRPGQPHSVEPGLCPSGRGLPAGLPSAQVPTAAGVPDTILQISGCRLHARPAV